MTRRDDDAHAPRAEHALDAVLTSEHFARLYGDLVVGVDMDGASHDEHSRGC